MFFCAVDLFIWKNLWHCSCAHIDNTEGINKMPDESTILSIVMKYRQIDIKFKNYDEKLNQRQKNNTNHKELWYNRMLKGHAIWLHA